MPVMSILCYPFIMTSCDPVNSIMILHIMLFRQRFLLASTFLSSSLIFELAFSPSTTLCVWPTSVAPRSLRLYHHHPSSPPIDVCCHQVLRYLLASSLPSHIISDCLPNHLSPCHEFVDPQRGVYEDNVLSTGKSSNSSSSSNAAAGFVSFVGSAFLSVVVALAAGAAPEAGAADMVAEAI